MLVYNRLDTATTGSAAVVSIRGFARKLEDLYARRSAVNALIQSLEDYERFRAKPLDFGSRKTA